MWYSHFHTEFNVRKSPSTELQKESLTNDTTKAAIQFNMHDLEKVISNSIARSLKKSYEHNFHILHAPRIALENILLGLNEWCKEACVNADIQPFDFLTSTINPIPKTGPRDLSMVKSWRPICCSSTVCFLFEKMLLNKLKPYLNTTDCQYAYKQNHGCLQPISIVREAEQKVSDFHVALLDATAAFDRISWRRIKKEFETRNIPQSMQSILYSFMSNTSFRVKWKDQLYNEVFFASKGVKQGGCISAIIFACCYDKLIESCTKSTAGIILHGTKLSILVYADDILLLAASPFALKTLLCITKKFFQQYNDIEVNNSKSAIMRMSIKGKKKPPISVNDIPTKSSAKYLGVWLSDELLEESKVVKSLYAKTNSLFRQNKQLSLCSQKSKKLLANAYGSIYGIEALPMIISKITGAHRYLIKSIYSKDWLHYADLSDGSGWIDIRSRTLYVGFDIRSVGEQYRLLRNNLILRSRKSNNVLVQSIVGKIDTR